MENSTNVTLHNLKSKENIPVSKKKYLYTEIILNIFLINFENLYQFY